MPSGESRITAEPAPSGPGGRRDLSGWSIASSGLVIVAVVFLAYAAISRRVEGTFITAPIVFVAVGFLCGPEGLDWFRSAVDQHTISLLAEATLAVVLFTDASRIDMRALRQDHSLPVRLLGIGLPLTIAAGALAGGTVLRGLSVAEALVLAVVLAPTDAALGQAVVTDVRLPARIRQGLNVESGLNDGLCVPLLTIALALAQTRARVTPDVHAWKLVAEAIGWGVLGGIVAGAGAAIVQRTAVSRGWMEGRWTQIVPVAGAAAAFGLADTRGGSGFIAAFVGGLAFGIISRGDGGSEQFAEEIGAVLNGLTLMVFGVAVLSAAWSDIGAAELTYAVLSLTVVRMIPVAIAMFGSHARLPTVVFVGWFGPRG